MSGITQWRGFVSNEHPSEVMPLQWPEVSGGSLTGTNNPAVQLGVSLEPLGNGCMASLESSHNSIIWQSTRTGPEHEILCMLMLNSCLKAVPAAPEEVVQREGTKLASRQEFAKRVAMDLFRFMESFNKGIQGDTLILPTNCLELWFQKFDNKFRR